MRANAIVMCGVLALACIGAECAEIVQAEKIFEDVDGRVAGPKQVCERIARDGGEVTLAREEGKKVRCRVEYKIQAVVGYLRQRADNGFRRLAVPGPLAQARYG